MQGNRLNLVSEFGELVISATNHTNVQAFCLTDLIGLAGLF